MKKLFAVTILLTLASCGKYNLDLNKEDLKGKTFKFTKETGTVGFSEQTMGNFLALSAASWLAGPTSSPQANNYATPVDPEKQKIISAYNPLEKIKAKVEDKLVKEFNGKKNNDTADYTIGFSTSGWGIKYHTLKVTNYNVFYKSYLILTKNEIDVNGITKSAYFNCNYNSEKDYSYDALFENNSSIIKSELEASVDYCAEYLFNKINSKNRNN